MPRKYKFSFHYHKIKRGASVHFRGKCIQAHDVELIGIHHLKSRHHARQPYWTVDGYAESVEVVDDVAVIRNNLRL